MVGIGITKVEFQGKLSMLCGIILSLAVYILYQLPNWLSQFDQIDSYMHLRSSND